MSTDSYMEKLRSIREKYGCPHLQLSNLIKKDGLQERNLNSSGFEWNRKKIIDQSSRVTNYPNYNQISFAASSLYSQPRTFTENQHPEPQPVYQPKRARFSEYDKDLKYPPQKVENNYTKHTYNYKERPSSFGEQKANYNREDSLVKTREKFVTAERGYHYPTTKTDLNKDMSSRYSDSYSLPKKTNFSNITSHEPPTKRTTIDHTSNTVYSVANINKIQERIRQALGETR